MTKKEQKEYIAEVLKTLRQNKLNVGFFLSKIDISRSHWFFLKKGERPLTDDKYRSIISFMDNFFPN